MTLLTWSSALPRGIVHCLFFRAIALSSGCSPSICNHVIYLPRLLDPQFPRTLVIFFFFTPGDSFSGVLDLLS